MTLGCASLKLLLIFACFIPLSNSMTLYKALEIPTTDEEIGHRIPTNSYIGKSRTKSMILSQSRTTNKASNSSNRDCILAVEYFTSLIVRSRHGFIQNEENNEDDNVDYEDDIDDSSLLIERKTLTTRKQSQLLQQNQRVDCPNPNGIFPFENDCTKFILCSNGKHKIQKCKAGFIFNKNTSGCELDSETRCNTATGRIQLNTPSRQQGPDRIYISPDSGQRLRLRGGRGPWEGYVTVRSGENLPWKYICTSSGNWSMKEANVVCRHLGFLRGAKVASQGTIHFGRRPKTSREISVGKFVCLGTEMNIKDCKIELDTNCNDCCGYVDDQVVSVQCRHDPYLQCAPGEYLNNNTCYKILSEEVTTNKQAQMLCQHEGGQLLHITSQNENDFISEILLQFYPTIKRVHTDGKAERNDFIWQHDNSSIEFIKWWPGWDSIIPPVAPFVHYSQCIMIRNQFPHSWNCVLAPYFFWTIADCDSNGAVICKKKPRELDCTIANGTDFQGKVNVSKTGRPCLNWNDPDIQDFLSKRGVRSLTAVKSASDATARTDNQDNYCRIQDEIDAEHDGQAAQSWCFVSPSEMEACDIPTQCPLDIDELTARPDYVDYLAEFSELKNNKLNLTADQKFNTSLEMCARQCVDAANYTCLSFSYFSEKEECHLSSSTRVSGSLAEIPGWSYFDRKTVNCSNGQSFKCPNGECISLMKICDNHNDCGDEFSSDEEDCESKLDFQIRLTGSENDYEGRVEVKVYGQWGTVCDHKWWRGGLNNANVICRSLGFPLGASNAVVRSGFGVGSPILMDEIQCRGNEKSLADCPFSGWRIHNCGTHETAGVRCKTDGVKPNSTTVVPVPERKSDVLPVGCSRGLNRESGNNKRGIASRIYNGTKASPEAYPWQATLWKGNAIECGATIIDKHFVVTAAHCLKQDEGYYRLRVGYLSTKDDLDESYQEFEIQKKILHANFEESQGQYLNDIAIVRVKSDENRGIRFNSYVRPLCPPPSSTTYEPGMNCTVTGWSASTNHRGSSNSPHSAVAKLLSNVNCKLKHPKLTTGSGVVCASSQNGASLGSGDADGGGLVCDVQGNSVLMGVASRKISRFITMYTGVVDYLPWIANLTIQNWQ